MINPDNTINSSKNNPKSIERGSGRPEGPVDKAKFQEVYHTKESRKKTQEELAEEWDDVESLNRKDGQEIVVAPTKKPKAPVQEQKSASIFDLAAKESKEPVIRKEPQVSAGKDELAFEDAPKAKTSTDFTLNDLAAEIKPKSELPDKGEGGSLFDLASQKTQEAVPHFKEKMSPQDLDANRYVPEAQDLSRVNFLANATPGTEVNVGTASTSIPQVDAARLQKIIDEIVEHVYQLEKSGESSTVITLSNKNSAFDGVSIKITEFDSAKGQFNITIDNLTAESKALVDKHQGLLLESLEKKGYQVQQFISTTTIENPRIAASQPDAKGSQEREPEQQKNGKEKQNSEEEKQEET